MGKYQKKTEGREWEGLVEYNSTTVVEGVCLISEFHLNNRESSYWPAICNTHHLGGTRQNALSGGQGLS